MKAAKIGPDLRLDVYLDTFGRWVPQVSREFLTMSRQLRQLSTTLHVHRAFLYISLSSLQDYDMKVPFGGGRKHNTATFVFLSRTSIQSLDEVNEMKKAR